MSTEVTANGSAAVPSWEEGAPVVVECTSVSRVFGHSPRAVAAVREVTVSVRAGMRIALTGSSGSGKSTLLHLMAGLDAPTGGTLRWPGLGGAAPGRPGVVGMVFQGPSLIPALTVAENVAMPALLVGANSRQAEDRAAAALEHVGIGDLASKLPEELSGGQAQRVAVARVLAGRPLLILADEPTGQLDHQAGERVVTVLLEATRELGAALVVATHDPSVAARVGQRWRMVDGRLAITTDEQAELSADGPRPC